MARLAAAAREQRRQDGAYSGGGAVLVHFGAVVGWEAAWSPCIRPVPAAPSMATLLSTTVRDPAHIQAVRLAIDKLRREHRDTLPPPSASKPSLASLLHDAPVSVFDIVSTTLDSEIRDLEAELASMQMDPVAGSRYSMAHYQARLTAAQLELFQLREQLAAAQAAAAAAQNEAAACRQELDAQRSAARELAGRATTWAQRRPCRR